MQTVLTIINIICSLLILACISLFVVLGIRWRRRVFGGREKIFGGCLVVLVVGLVILLVFSNTAPYYFNLPYLNDNCLPVKLVSGNYEFSYPGDRSKLEECNGVSGVCDSCTFMKNLSTNCAPDMTTLLDQAGRGDVPDLLRNKDVEMFQKKIGYQAKCGCYPTDRQIGVLESIQKNVTKNTAECGLYGKCYPELNELTLECLRQSGSDDCSNCELVGISGSDCGKLLDPPSEMELTIDRGLLRRIEFAERCGCLPSTTQLETFVKLGSNCSREVCPEIADWYNGCSVSQ